MGSIRWKMATLYILLACTVMIGSGVFILLSFRDQSYKEVYQECEYTADRIIDMLSVQEIEDEEALKKLFGETATALVIESVNSDTASGSEKQLYLLSAGGEVLYARNETSREALASRALVSVQAGEAMTEVYAHEDYTSGEQVADYAVLFTLPQTADTYILMIRQSLVSVTRSLSNMTRIILIVTAIGIFIAGALGFFLAESISRPIVSLTQKTQELASGHLEAALPKETDEGEKRQTSSDELGELELNFDEMARELSTSIIELKAMEEMQKEFVANVSHELRTPITTIKSYVETILDSDMEDKEMTRHFLTVVDKESDRMTALIQDLLELSKMDAHQEKLVLRPVELGLMLHRNMEYLSFEAGKKQQDLDWEKDVLLLEEPEVGEKYPVPAADFYVNGDPRRIEQVVRNLMTNAIKYTPEKGHIRIGIYRDEEEVRIKVRDDGIGISEEDQKKIFERFYRVDKARSRSMGGTGLGLSIARQIVELHDGSIWVESEIGQGSTFWVAFPAYLPEDEEAME